MAAILVGTEEPMSNNILQKPVRIAKCPVCKAPNVSIAHILGHGNKGKRKKFSKEHRQFLSDSMKRIQASRAERLNLAKKVGVNTEKK